MPGVYVFDYDGTLRPLFCGDNRDEARQRVRDVIQYALDHGHVIGINTARLVLPSKHKKYLRSIGIDVDRLPSGAVQLGGITSSKKVRNLERIKQTYEAVYGPIQRIDMMFFDDKESNITAARLAGYNAVLVKPVDGGCLAVSLRT